MLKDNGIKWQKMGMGYLVKPTEGNLVIPLLAQFNVLPDQIVGYAYKGDEFQDLDANKYDIRDFLIALRDTFEKFTRKPTQGETIIKLRQHERCQIKESDGPIQNQTRTLRGWLKKAGFKNLDDAWDDYRQSIESGK